MKYSIAIAALIGNISAVKLEKDLFHELHLRDIGGVTKTWERGTTNMVDGEQKKQVADIGRDMAVDPAKSRAQWQSTRDDSIKVAAKQRATEAAWTSEWATDEAKYRTATYDRIMENKVKRDDGMKAYMTNPPSYDDQAKVAKGFELDGPSKEAAAEAEEPAKEAAAVQLFASPDNKAGPANQADLSFQKAIKVAHAAVARQQNYESTWEAEHAGNLADAASSTHNKRLTNYRAREGVYQNNWHHKDTWPAMVQLEEAPARFSADSDDLFMRSVVNNYSTEGKNKDGSGNGVFTISEGQAKALATEVIGTHKAIKGDALTAYFGNFWAKSWGHFDVNKTGGIPILYAPQLMRFFMSDQYVQLQ